MSTAVRSYGKINLGLVLGGLREDGFHELRTCYSTIGLYDTVKVEKQRGTGIEIRAKGSKGSPAGDELAAEFAAEYPATNPTPATASPKS